MCEWNSNWSTWLKIRFNNNEKKIHMNSTRSTPKRNFFLLLLLSISFSLSLLSKNNLLDLRFFLFPKKKFLFFHFHFDNIQNSSQRRKRSREKYWNFSVHWIYSTIKKFSLFFMVDAPAFLTWMIRVWNKIY